MVQGGAPGHDSFVGAQITPSSLWFMVLTYNYSIHGVNLNQLIYPLVNIQKTMENHNLLMGKLTINGHVQ